MRTLSGSSGTGSLVSRCAPRGGVGGGGWGGPQMGEGVGTKFASSGLRSAHHPVD